MTMNQNYVSKVLSNPKIPREDREVVIAYVPNHLDMFTPLAQNADDPVHDGLASERNVTADLSFVTAFGRRCL